MFNCVAIYHGEVLDSETLRRVLLYNKGAGSNRPLEIRLVSVAQNAEALEQVRKSMRKKRLAYVRLYDHSGAWDGDYLYA